MRGESSGCRTPKAQPWKLYNITSAAFNHLADFCCGRGLQKGLTIEKRDLSGERGDVTNVN